MIKHNRCQNVGHKREGKRVAKENEHQKGGRKNRGRWRKQEERRKNDKVYLLYNPTVHKSFLIKHLHIF